MNAKIVFNQAGDFSAMQAAEQWCRENDVSYGSTQMGNPRGLVRGECDISKWRNLSRQDIAELDGTMTGDMRNGPVTINIKTIEVAV